MVAHQQQVPTEREVRHEPDDRIIVVGGFPDGGQAAIEPCGVGDEKAGGDRSNEVLVRREPHRLAQLSVEVVEVESVMEPKV